MPTIKTKTALFAGIVGEIIGRITRFIHMNWSNSNYFGEIVDGVLKLSKESQAKLAKENVERICSQGINNGENS